MIGGLLTNSKKAVEEDEGEAYVEPAPSSACVSYPTKPVSLVVRSHITIHFQLSVAKSSRANIIAMKKKKKIALDTSSK